MDIQGLFVIIDDSLKVSDEVLLFIDLILQIKDFGVFDLELNIILDCGFKNELIHH